MTNENWTKELKCKFCDEKFIISEKDIKFEDLKTEDQFIPDWQYCVICSNCVVKIVVNVPSSIALSIQLSKPEETEK